MTFRPRPRVYFYRHGKELANHPYNGAEHVGFGVYSGKVSTVCCFRSILVRDTVEHELTERDFGGQPVMAKVWSPEGQTNWFAVASPQSVEKRILLEGAAKPVSVPARIPVRI